jgi:hypothetical protein
MVAWMEACDSAPKSHQLNLRTVERPIVWQETATSDFTMSLLASSDALGSADVRLSDGTNTIVVTLSRPMWARGPDLHTAGSFTARLELELGLTHNTNTPVSLGVDVNSPALKFKAATAAIRGLICDVDTTVMQCAMLTSASPTAERFTLVRVRPDFAFAVCRTRDFPANLVTSQRVRTAIANVGMQRGPVASDDITTHGFLCANGAHILMICAHAAAHDNVQVTT